jgi:hypothetical protein
MTRTDDTVPLGRAHTQVTNRTNEEDYSVVSMVRDDMVLVVVVDDPLFVQLSTA